MATIAGTSTAEEPRRAGSQPLVAPGMTLLFIALISCFTVWGVAQDLTTPMVAGFKRIFDMSTFQASLVQLAYFGAYFLLALPAAFINQRFGYKAGILTGLGLAALGAFMFFPASKIMTYEAFLLALFAMAAGCSILETSANPYVLSLGPEETATRRLNFAQAFNPSEPTWRAPGRHLDPPQARRARRHLDAVGGRAALHPCRGTGGRDGALSRAGCRPAPHRGRHRDPEGFRDDLLAAVSQGEVPPRW
jgi:hypothetical protein